MSTRARVVLALLATVTIVAGVIWHDVSRLRHWHEIGVAGLTYFPDLPERERPPLAMFAPGRVFMTFPTGPAARAGIRASDFVEAINGVPIRENDVLIANAAKLRAGEVVTYRIRRGEERREVRIRLVSPLEIPLYVTTCIVAAIVGIAYLAIGLLVLAKRPEDRRVMVFFAMVIVGALYLFLSPALSLDSSNIRGLNAETRAQNLLPFLVFAAAFIAFLPLTLHLALIFPRERPIVRSSLHVFRWVYGVPGAAVVGLILFTAMAMLASASPDAVKRLDTPLNVFAAAVTLAGMLVAWRIARIAREEGLASAFWRRPIQSILVFTAVLLAISRIAAVLKLKWLAITAGLFVGFAPVLALMSFPVLSCIALYRSYRDAGAEERQQVKWPLWGTLIALATRLTIVVVVQVVTAFLMFSGGDAGEWLGRVQYVSVLSTLVYLLIPISFAVAILKYRLMNIDVIIRKTVVYAILSGAIVVVYLVLVGGLGTLLLEVAGVHNQTIVIASTLVVALLFVPLRNKLQTLVDRNLFRHKYDYPEALKSIAAETLAGGDLSAFLASAAEKLQRALQNRAVVIFATRHDELVAAAKVGLADTILGTLRIAREPLLPMLVRPFDPRRHELPEDAAAALRRIEAVLVVPINTPGTPANGFIALAAKLSGGAFEVEDIDFLRSVADQLDIGMDRIRLQREEVDYEQARAIQQTLLPRVMPRVAGLEVSGVWQPARTVGGDYYDLIELGERELAVCIGDVAGKGMSAALLMSGLQAAVRASASGSPRDLCERVRRVVISSLSGGRFVTFFYATIDTAAMRLRWTNAGHNAPMLVRGDGVVVRLADGGPAFSRLFRDDSYVERETDVAPGDRIILFTDGVSEAGGAGGEMFGEARLEEIVRANGTLPARELQQNIVDAATTFSGGELEDDLTLVVVRVTGMTESAQNVPRAEA